MKPFLILFALFLLIQIIFLDVGTFRCINAAGEILISNTECEGEKPTLLQRAEHLFKTAKLKINVYLSSQNTSKMSEPRFKNLLKNATFENKLTAWHIPQDTFWSADKGFQKSGALSLQARQPPDNKYIYETKVTQCVILGTGIKFKLSAQFFTASTPLKAHANRANVTWYESTDCSVGGQWGSYIEPDPQNPGWQELKGADLTPALGAKAAMISIVQSGRYSEGGIAYWDNIHFAPTAITPTPKQVINRVADDQFTLALGVNYVANGEFDSHLDNWHAPQQAEWSESQGDSSPGSAKVTVVSTSGSRGEHAISQCITFGEHAIFKLGASYKKEQASTQMGGGRLRLIWYGQKNCRGAAKIDPDWTDPGDYSGWQKLQIARLIAPKNAQSAKVDIIQSISGAGQFSMYWDNIYFIALE